MSQQQQDTAVDAEKVLELRSVLHGYGLESFLGESNESLTDCVRILLQYGAGRQVSTLSSVCRNLDKETSFNEQEVSSSAGEVKPELAISKQANFLPGSGFFTQRLTNLCLCDIDNGGDQCPPNTSECSAVAASESDLTETSTADERSVLLNSPKSETCRYFAMPGGCVRGEKCFFSHSEETLSRTRFILADIQHSFVSRQLGGSKRITEDLSKKIFVGGLSPSVESDDLRDFFEEKYGPVLDAVVIGSQSGDHMQSRGFGFVTFKYADSVAAAVEAHYINIYGKKVEIKSAVPRSEIPALESSPRTDSGSPEDQSHTAMSANRMLDLDEAEVLEVATPGSLSQPKIESPQAKWMRLVSERQPAPTAASAVEVANSRATRLTSTKECHVPNIDSNNPQPLIRGSSSTGSVQGTIPIWLGKFRQWLPKFLSGVSMRLKEGEWYPLSSLKGDFRATCGLELDHLSLGYEKLSDFVRSFPDLCRMKIVPVGRGPATHMVLLPSLSRTTQLPPGRPACAPNITTRSLVDGSRTYADVACQGATTKLVRPPTTLPSASGHQVAQQGAPKPPEITSSNVQPLALEQSRGPSIIGGGPISYAAMACKGSVSGNIGSTSTSALPLNVTGNFSRLSSSGYVRGHGRIDSEIEATKCSGSSSSEMATVVTAGTTAPIEAPTIDTNKISGIGPDTFSEEDWAVLQELIFRLRKTGIDQAQVLDHKTRSSIVDPVPTSNNLVSPFPRHESAPQVSANPQALMQNVSTDQRQKSMWSPSLNDQEPRTPKNQINSKPFTAFGHPFPGFLQENYAPFNMWGQPTSGNRGKEELYSNGGHALNKSSPSCQFYEKFQDVQESPHSSESYGTPNGFLPSLSSPIQGYSTNPGPCEMCFERQALWVGVPCGHQGFCSICKDKLRYGIQENVQCSICNDYVERWIALY